MEDDDGTLPDDDVNGVNPFSSLAADTPTSLRGRRNRVRRPFGCSLLPSLGFPFLSVDTFQSS
jgi:hypothetical protein